MRLVQLLLTALQVEEIRLQRKAASTIQRAVLVATGSIFVMLALIDCEYAGLLDLSRHISASSAALIIATTHMAAAAFILFSTRKRQLAYCP